MHSALNQNFFLEINMGTLFQMNKKKNLHFIAAHWITKISTKLTWRILSLRHYWNLRGKVVRCTLVTFDKSQYYDNQYQQEHTANCHNHYNCDRYCSVYNISYATWRNEKSIHIQRRKQIQMYFWRRSLRRRTY